jgi:hypothetical protein
MRPRTAALFLCTLALSWWAGPSVAADEPKCLLREGFEAQGTAYRLKPGAAVVSREQGAEPHSGDRCLRGNWDPKVTDPITGIAGAKGAGMDVELAKVGVRTECYVSLYWRLDPDVKFETENKGQPGAFPGYKLAYIMGTPWDNTVNWVIGQPYTIDSWWLVDNVPKENTGYLVRAKTSAEAGRAGVWHHVEFYLKMNSVPRAPDGACWLRVDGETVFDRTDVPFMHGTANETWGSVGLPCMFGGAFAPAESFGWQLDDLEVWDGVPPATQKKETPAPSPATAEPATR